MSLHDPGLRCDIRVTDELRVLARAAGRRSTAPSLPLPAHRTAGASEQGSGSILHCLRRDGKRPFKFRGRPLLRFEQAAMEAGKAQIDVFLSDDNRMVVQTSTIPADGVPARACFRVYVPSDAEDFARSVSEAALQPRAEAICEKPDTAISQLQAFSRLCAAVSRTAATYSKQQH